MLSSIVSWTLVSLAGVCLAVIASQWAVRHASMLAHGLSIPPFLLGVTFFALGTDIPEIATSVMSAIDGRGDILLGDSIGSVVTQTTLILGLLPFAAQGGNLGRLHSLAAPLLTVALLILSVLVVLDGRLSRMDAMLLIVAWCAAIGTLWRLAPPYVDAELPPPSYRKSIHALLATGSMVLVVIGAGAAVQGIVRLSSAAGIPQYAISFFGASIGTSLPEIVFSLVAVRRGQRDLALGDIFGACLTDASLSIGAGPAVAPAAVTANLAIRGGLLAIAAMALATALLWKRQRFDRWAGAALLALYGVGYLIL
jgi:cation:H+ antiporter